VCEANSETQRGHLVLRQLTPLPELEALELEVGIPHAMETVHRVTDGFAHPSDLVLATLVERELEPTEARPAAHKADESRRRHAVLELDPLT
jgi:hypothetical protein